MIEKALPWSVLRKPGSKPNQKPTFGGDTLLIFIFATAQASGKNATTYMDAYMYINHRYGPSGKPSGVELCRKVEKAIQQVN